MTIYTFEKGSNAVIYADENKICGVISINTQEKHPSYEIKSFLQGESVDTLPLKREYKIAISKLKDNKFAADDLSDFVLRVNVKNRSYKYSGCQVESIYEDIQGKENVKQTINILAKDKIMEVVV